MRVVVAIAVALLAAAPAEAAVASGWTWPVDGDVIAQFHHRALSPYAGGQHRGVDVAAAPGTPVVAAAGGTVRFAGTAGSSGLTVSIRTSDGRYDTSYLHLSSIAVGTGQVVSTGQRIGESGTTGSPSSTEPHLHFGVRRAGTSHGYVDPLGLLPAPPGAPDGPRGVPVAVPAPIGTAPRAVPVRVGPPPVPARGLRLATDGAEARSALARLPRFEPAAAPAPAGLRVGVALAGACAMLAAGLVASSIGSSCRTTSRRRSTTSTASRTSATSTRPSPPTCSPVTCASAATTSSS